MKCGTKFVLRLLGVCLIVTLLQSYLLGSHASLNPLSPPPTQSPQDTYSAFISNTNDAYRLIMDAHEKSQAEGGFRASEEVLALAHQAEESMERAIETLNLEGIPLAERKSQGIELTLLLRETLDRIDKPDVSSIPNAQVVSDTGLEHWEVPNTQIAIVKTVEGFRKDEFLFSEDTLNHIRFFYEEVKDLPYQENSLEDFYRFYIGTPGFLLPPKWSHFLPRWSKRMIWEQTIWQWGGLILLSLLSLLTLKLTYRLNRFPRRESIQHDSHSQAQAWRGLIMPAVIALNCILSEHLLINVFNLTGRVAITLMVILESLRYIALAWFGFMFFNALGRSVIAGFYFDKDYLLEATISRNGFRILGFTVAVTLLYIGGQQIGLPTGPLVASLGIGGLAISLGVQPYIKNLIGGIILFVNRPVKIGDFCELGGVTGTVEDIGLRTTSIRTPERNLVIIPNSVVSESQVVNYSRRDRRLINFVVGLRCDMSRQQLIDSIRKIKSCLGLHHMIINDHVRFIGLGKSSLDVEVFAYVLTTDHTEFLQIQESILIQIMEIIEVADIEFLDKPNEYVSEESMPI